MIVLDANTIVSSIIGKHTRVVVKDALMRSIRFGTPQRQVEEAAHVLIEKLAVPTADATALLDEFMHGVELIPEAAYTDFESIARQRLHERGQSDWPILAAALAYDAGIWTNDRDFFGVGVPVWSTRNIGYAEGRV